MSSASLWMLFIGVLLVALAIYLFVLLYKRKSQILLDGETQAKGIIDNACVQAEEMIADANNKVFLSEQRIERLKAADKEIVSRLKEARKLIENITDLSSQHAADIELITDEDLLSSPEYQEDRKDVHRKLKKLACDAIDGVKGHGSDVNIGKFVAISAKADMAGALLLTTVDMLCAKVTSNNAKQAFEKLHESIIAAEALIKSIDSRATVNKEFRALLLRRLEIEVNFKKAKQIAKEKQRELREQEREEKRVRQEAERLQKEAEKEEKIKLQAIEELEIKLNEQNESDRAKYEAELELLRAELVAAHEKFERAKSRAQETKQGHVYIISNIGSFGDKILKIGMTRRLDPLDRVKELGDASVPFSFDIHALIECEDAPTLESKLHKIFHGRRVNKVNNRKEYFRVNIDEIEKKLEEFGISALINKVPSADEYYQSIKMEDKLQNQDELLSEN